VLPEVPTKIRTALYSTSAEPDAAAQSQETR
jgi:hypothetical protein